MTAFLFEKPVVDMTDLRGVWDLAVRVYDAFEALDGNRKRANRWHCEFMRLKEDAEALSAYTETLITIQDGT